MEGNIYYPMRMYFRNVVEIIGRSSCKYWNGHGALS